MKRGSTVLLLGGAAAFLILGSRDKPSKVRHDAASAISREIQRVTPEELPAPGPIDYKGPRLPAMAYTLGPNGAKLLVTIYWNPAYEPLSDVLANILLHGHGFDTSKMPPKGEWEAIVYQDDKPIAFAAGSTAQKAMEDVRSVVIQWVLKQADRATVELWSMF